MLPVSSFYPPVPIDFDFDDVIQTRNTLTAKVFTTFLYPSRSTYRNRLLHFLKTNKEAYRSSYEDSNLFDLHFWTSFSFVNRLVAEIVIRQSKLLGARETHYVISTIRRFVERSSRIFLFQWADPYNCSRY